MCGMQILIHSQISTVRWSLGMDEVISSHTLYSMWLLFYVTFDKRPPHI